MREGEYADNTQISSGHEPKLVSISLREAQTQVRAVDNQAYLPKCSTTHAIGLFGTLLLGSVVTRVVVQFGARQLLTHLKSGKSQSSSWGGEDVCLSFASLGNPRSQNSGARSSGACLSPARLSLAAQRPEGKRKKPYPLS